jgi:hypothetical protein
MGLGWVLEIISCGNSCKETNGRYELMKVKSADNATANIAPLIKAEIADFNSVLRPIIEARPIPIMGDINGATNIAPMMTAGELVIKPRVAILVERMTSRK